jgi:hypothetical protein
MCLPLFFLSHGILLLAGVYWHSVFPEQGHTARTYCLLAGREKFPHSFGVAEVLGVRCCCVRTHEKQMLCFS